MLAFTELDLLQIGTIVREASASLAFPACSLAQETNTAEIANAQSANFKFLSMINIL